MAKIPSTATGKVTEINFGDDDICPVGHVLLKIEEADGASSEVEAAVPDTSAQAAPQAEEPAATPDKTVADKVSTAPPGN